MKIIINQKRFNKLCGELGLDVPNIVIKPFCQEMTDEDELKKRGSYTKGLYDPPTQTIYLYEQCEDWLLREQNIKEKRYPFTFDYWSLMKSWHRDHWVKTLLHELRHHYQRQVINRTGDLGTQFLLIDHARPYENQFREKDAEEWAKANYKKYRRLLKVKLA